MRDFFFFSCWRISLDISLNICKSSLPWRQLFYLSWFKTSKGCFVFWSSSNYLYPKMEKWAFILLRKSPAPLMSKGRRLQTHVFCGVMWVDLNLQVLVDHFVPPGRWCCASGVCVYMCKCNMEVYPFHSVRQENCKERKQISLLLACRSPKRSRFPRWYSLPLLWDFIS